MKRLTNGKAAQNMTAYELAHNCMIVKEHEAWFRDFEREIPLRRLIREIAECNNIMLPEEDEEFDEYMYCCLQYDPAENLEGFLALLNMLAWSHAENREKLKEYEDADEAGLIAACHCGDCAHKEWRGESGRVYCQETNSWRDEDDFCKYAKKESIDE